ncbi:MAG: hypothetical protein ACREO3_02875 [Arenimonas sp.]
MRRLPILLTLSALLLALTACAEPPPERLSTEAKKAREHHELRDQINTPIDKAKGVEDVQEKQAEDQKKAIEDQGG